MAQVVIRRSKQQIFNPDGTRKFQDRAVYHLELSLADPALAAEKRLYDAVQRYVTRHWRAAQRDSNQQAMVGFAMTLLKKRLISSLGAIRASLRTRLEGLTDELVAPDARRGLLASYRAGVPLTETQREHVERQVVTLTPERGSEALERERREVERLLSLAEKITPENDHKAALLKRTLDRFCLQQGRKVIVFTEYKDTLDYLYDYLTQHGYAERIALLHGHLDRQGRLNAERLFHQSQTLVLLATDAASEGLNFQHGCWTVIHNELPWNPNRLEQRNGRVDRWGQTHPVEVYNLVYADTLEARILALLEEKLQRIRADLGSVSDVLSLTRPLDLDTLMMNAATEAEELPLPVAVQNAGQELELTLQQGRDALDSWHAQLLITPTTFGPQEYQTIEQAKQTTQHMLPTDDELEQFVLATLTQLGGRATPISGMAHVWTLDIPQSMRREGVRDHYDYATFGRETALADAEHPPRIEFLAPGHPLLDALIAFVKNEALNASTGRMTVRVLPQVARGFLFVYRGRWQDGRGAVTAEALVPLFLGLDGTVITGTRAEALLAQPTMPRNAPQALLTEVYQPDWERLREQAEAEARAYCRYLEAQVQQAQQPQLALLRRDIEYWAEARTQWVARQSARRAEQEATQLPLFDAERARALAAAETRRKNDLLREHEVIVNRKQEREREITRMEQITAAVPELIGALVIVPLEEC